MDKSIHSAPEIPAKADIFKMLDSIDSVLSFYEKRDNPFVSSARVDFDNFRCNLTRMLYHKGRT